jgi:hypothetical protein
MSFEVESWVLNAQCLNLWVLNPWVFNPWVFKIHGLHKCQKCTKAKANSAFWSFATRELTKGKRGEKELLEFCHS